MKQIANQFSTGSTIEKVVVGDDQKAVKALSKKWRCRIIKNEITDHPDCMELHGFFFCGVVLGQARWAGGLSVSGDMLDCLERRHKLR
jgi:hypothetical protein